MAISEDWVADLLKGYTRITQDGTPVVQRKTLDLIGASVEDDPNYVDPSTGEIVGRTRLTVDTGDVQPFLISTLRTTVPGGSREVRNVDGYAAQSDGGEGVFFWDNTSTAGDDSGTIIKVGSVNTGRWRRLNAKDGVWNVRWFGATGNGTTNDEPAIRQCIAAASAASTLRPPTAVGSAYNGPIVYFPAGVYLVNATVEFPNSVRAVGEGGGAKSWIYNPGTTVNLVRSATFFNSFENLGFQGGKSAIVFWGNSVHYGDLSNATVYGSNEIKGCTFWAHAGPAIYLDTTTLHRTSSATLTVGGGCTFYTACAAHVGFDRFVVEAGTNVFAAQTQGPSWAVPALDDDGNPLPVFVNLDHMDLRGVHGIPTAADVVPSSVWLAGTGRINATKCRFGGESSLGIGRTTTHLKYNGVTIATEAAGVYPEVRLHDCDLSSTSRGATTYVNGRNIWECYDQIPNVFEIIHHGPDLGDHTPTPTNPDGSMPGNGIWIDSATIAKSQFATTGTDRLWLQWNLDCFGQYGANVRYGTDPTSLGGEVVTECFFPFMTPHSWPKQAPLPALGQVKNLWPVDKQDINALTTDHLALSGLTAGAPETETGLGLTQYTASAFPASLNAAFNNITSGLAAGLYTFSFSMRSTVGGVMQVEWVHPTTGANHAAMDQINFIASPERVRYSTTFYHDGSTNLGIGFQTFLLPVSGGVFPTTAVLDLGLFKLEPGAKATPWTTSGAPTLARKVITEYNVAGAPPTTGGPYVEGDIAWNTDFQASRVDYWRCTSGGSPGAWTVGNTLPFDPSQIPGYAFDLDASLLTPGAITAWLSKTAGWTVNHPINLAGTATAHAAGGTGPNGAAYVSCNGTTDALFDGSFSSVIVATELYIVAKMDNAGTETTGTLIDGGTGNVTRAYLDAATTQWKFTGDASDHTISAPNQSAWSIWHIIYDQVAGELTVIVNGNTVINAAATAAQGLSNGLTLGNFGAPGGDPAKCSFARVVGFRRTLATTGDGHLTSGEHTDMATNFSTLYGVT